MSLKPKVALSQDFLLQLAKLPVNVHTKVMKWAILFQTDPKSPSINYENINGARDPNLKSVRTGAALCSSQARVMSMCCSTWTTTTMRIAGPKTAS